MMMKQGIERYYHWAVVVLIMLLATACVKGNEQEGIYKECKVVGRVMESCSQEPVGGLTVRLTCEQTTLTTTTTDDAGAFAFTLTNEQRAKGCTVVVSPDSLYTEGSAEVPSSGFGKKEIDVGVIYVDGPQMPLVHTYDVHGGDVSATKAVLSGTVAEGGRSAIVSRGFVYSTMQYHSLLNGNTLVGGTVGYFSTTIEGLLPNTTYYVRAFATNGVGTAYGEQKMFTTRTGLASVRTAREVTMMGSRSATCGGEVTDDGGFSVIARGVCWSMMPEPTVNNLHSNDGTGVGVFVSTIEGLQPSTTYYLRAYASNSNGTAYGEQRTITTMSGLAEVRTAEVGSITTTSAVCGGEVLTDGGYVVTQRGVCYSTTPNPTTEGMHTTDGSGMGTFVSHLTGLTPNTTYYYRAYASNSNGTVYGEEKRLRTT